jgi:HemY protein
VPISPVTGRIDAFVWQAPPDVLGAPELTMGDDVTGDIDEEPRILPPIAPDEVAVSAPAETVRAEAAIVADEPVSVEPQVVQERAESSEVTAKEPAKETPAEAASHRPEPVIFPVTPPDVPKLKEAGGSRRGLFG